MKILYLLPSLDYNGAAKEAWLLGRSLATSCDLHVCALGDEGRWAASLRQAGAGVRCLGWRHTVDPRPVRRLHCLLRDLRPDVIHVWRLPALRALALAGPAYLSRCLVSQALPKGWPGRTDQTNLGILDRWLLRRVSTIAAGGSWEAGYLEDLGFGRGRVTVIPPGVEVAQTLEARPMATAPIDANKSHSNGVLGQRIICLGNLEPCKGFREALRAADFLAYPFRDLHFHLIGDGPQLPALLRCENGIYHRDRIRLMRSRPDADAWLRSADLCWVPSLAPTGRHVILEAMAAGCPAIASDLPALREIVLDGATGLLVKPGDRLGLARQSRQLLLDENWRLRLAQAAKHRVQQHFSAAVFIHRWRAQYGLDSFTFPRAATPARIGMACSAAPTSGSGA